MSDVKPTITTKWTEKEVDGLIFRLLQRAYRTDGKVVRFMVEHLRNALLKELT